MFFCPPNNKFNWKMGSEKIEDIQNLLYGIKKKEAAFTQLLPLLITKCTMKLFISVWSSSSRCVGLDIPCYNNRYHQPDVAYRNQ